MKKPVFVYLLIILCIFLAGYNALAAFAAPHNMSAVDTVKYYFQQWNDKNALKMMGVLYTLQWFSVFNLSSLQSVTLVSCEEEKDQSNVQEYYEPAWYYKKPYAIAMVYTKSEIIYKNGSDGLESTENDWTYTLVKDSEQSDWIIVSYGYA